MLDPGENTITATLSDPAENSAGTTINVTLFLKERRFVFESLQSQRRDLYRLRNTGPLLRVNRLYRCAKGFLLFLYFIFHLDPHTYPARPGICRKVDQVPFSVLSFWYDSPRLRHTLVSTPWRKFPYFEKSFRYNRHHCDLNHVRYTP